MDGPYGYNIWWLLLLFLLLIICISFRLLTFIIRKFQSSIYKTPIHSCCRTSFIKLCVGGSWSQFCRATEAALSFLLALMLLPKASDILSLIAYIVFQRKSSPYSYKAEWNSMLKEHSKRKKKPGSDQGRITVAQCHTMRQILEVNRTHNQKIFINFVDLAFNSYYCIWHVESRNTRSTDQTSTQNSMTINT